MNGRAFCGCALTVSLLLKRWIPVSIRERKPAKTSRWIHLYLNLVPFRFAGDIGRIEAHGILMAKLQCDSRAYLDKFRLIISVGAECAAAGHPVHSFQYPTPKARERIVDRIRNPDRIDLHVRLFDPVAKFFVSVAAVIVLSVRDY